MVFVAAGPWGVVIAPVAGLCEVAVSSTPWWDRRRPAGVAATAVDLARVQAAQAKPAGGTEEEELPPPGHLMVGRLLRMVIESSALEEPFGATAVAAEANLAAVARRRPR